MGHTRRDRILALAQGTGLRILDVGCARGVLGNTLRKRGNWVGGIELSREAAAIAGTQLDAVWSFDIQQEWPAELQRGDIDIVIISEVVEHVFDPVFVLKRVRAALKESGAVVLTTPNFMTWTNRLRFLLGAFQYQEQGMFDFGHIRWFTYRYLREVLAQAGFRIAAERHILFPGKLAWLVRHWPSLFAFQFVVQAKPV
ncbi:MAG: class I SAM-dependent methyltransferase [Candidatus Yanofskybacteria bacterium]|nr:class I SAM-dependent methyltransferase [Candidatus Yanofskybacteria bacterium]